MCPGQEILGRKRRLHAGDMAGVRPGPHAGQLQHPHGKLHPGQQDPLLRPQAGQRHGQEDQDDLRGMCDYVLFSHATEVEII